MAAPILGLVLPAMSEASANLIGQRLRQRMSHLHPHIESTVSFVPEKGRCKAPRIKPSWSELVLVPVNATHLHSSPPQLTRHAEDIVGIIRTWPSAWPGPPARPRLCSTSSMHVCDWQPIACTPRNWMHSSSRPPTAETSGARPCSPK